MSYHTLRSSFPLASLFIWLSLTSLASYALDSEITSGLRTQLQPLSDRSSLLDITNAGDTLVAVGERGHVLVLDESWQQASTPTNTLLTKVFFVSDALGWAVGHDATILHTQDGGHHWQVQRESKEQEVPFLDVLFFDEAQGIAVGAYGLFYRTSDGGNTWNSEFHQELLLPEDRDYLLELQASEPELYEQEKTYMLPHFNRVIQLSDQRLLLLGERGLVAVSNDKGQHFTPLDLGYDGSMFAAAELNGHIYVGGLRGNMFQTDLDLAHWQPLPLPITSSINGLVSDDKAGLYVTANAGNLVYLAPDSQLHLLPGRQGENLVDMAQDGQGQFWLVGSGGVVKTAAK
ncbi:YCF48-related protein [Shewanella sp. NIFS-20-20]|uniref:YCF48-related protein n=1 Tax=Shewanella sp. NIFS-20-20 TaxID=2853806 RepID=UPI001C44877E|nr:YCF48-related protein [Shewanella sp. NIFS-20-20]MBV7314615.1 hypothetical protein [Shewanella sp. NIFS-20-20]